MECSVCKTVGRIMFLFPLLFNSPIKFWLFEQLPNKIKHTFDICKTNEINKVKWIHKMSWQKLWLSAINLNCYNLFFQLIFVHRHHFAYIQEFSDTFTYTIRRICNVLFLFFGVYHEMESIDRSMRTKFVASHWAD